MHLHLASSIHLVEPLDTVSRLTSPLNVDYALWALHVTCNLYYYSRRMQMSPHKYVLF